MSHHRALPAALAVLALAACSPSAPTAGPTEPAPASSEARHSPAVEGTQPGQGTPGCDEANQRGQLDVLSLDAAAYAL